MNLLPPNLFSPSELTFIVGNGSTLRQTVFKHWAKLNKRQLVVTNMACALFPRASMHVTVDCGWWGSNAWAREFSGLRCVAVENLSRAPHARQRGQYDEIFFCKSNEPFCTHPLGLAGNWSGVAATNAAFHAGAREVVLIGFDGFQEGKPIHWYGDRRATRDDCGPDFENYSAAMSAFARAAKQAGMEILNASPRSTLDCFERVRLEKLL